MFVEQKVFKNIPTVVNYNRKFEQRKNCNGKTHENRYIKVQWLKLNFFKTLNIFFKQKAD